MISGKTNKNKIIKKLKIKLDIKDNINDCR